MLGAVLSPAAHPWGRAARNRCPSVPGTGCVGSMGGSAPERALLRAGVARCGGGRRASPWGFALRRCEGRLRPGARASPAVRPQGGLTGSATHLLWARACERGGPALALWPVCPAGGCVPRGWWEAVPGGGGLPSLSGASVVRRCPSPGRPSLGAGSQDPLPVCPGHEWCGYGGPSTGPTARALASRRCAPWRWREVVPRGDALRRSEGHLRSGARPPLAAQPQGGLSGSATYVLWARACGRAGPALSLWLACPAGGCVPRGWWEAVPEGGGLPPL